MLEEVMESVCDELEAEEMEAREMQDFMLNSNSGYDDELQKQHLPYSSAQASASQDPVTLPYSNVMATQISPLLQILSMDEEYVVRQHLAEQIGFLGRNIMDRELKKAKADRKATGVKNSALGEHLKETWKPLRRLCRRFDSFLWLIITINRLQAIARFILKRSFH
jgi:hypothetical protein